MNERPTVGVIGVGMVGGQVERWFREVRDYRPGEDLFCYDADPARGHRDDIAGAEVVFVCVPTPSRADGSCDTDIVERVVAGIPDGRIVVIKSTVPPGTTQRLQKRLPHLALIFNPEFLTVSTAWTDFVRPDRQIIGVTPQSAPFGERVLALLPKTPWSAPEVITSTEAELVKYAGNVFGAVKVVFANVIADLCHAFECVSGEPVDDGVVRGMLGADKRIGPTWLDVHHGGYNGFGGGCLPKDTSAFLEFIRKLKDDFINRALTSGGVGRASTLQEGLTFLRQAVAYNEQLLAEQGLTVADVSSGHLATALKKRRRIRTR